MGNNVYFRKEVITMRITIKNLEIFISPEELKALQNEKPAEIKKENKATEASVKKTEEENKKTEGKIINNKIGF